MTVSLGSSKRLRGVSPSLSRASLRAAGLRRILRVSELLLPLLLLLLDAAVLLRLWLLLLLVVADLLDVVV